MNPMAVLSCCALGLAGQQPPSIEDKVAAALREVDPARIEATVRTLAGFGTRHVLSRTDSETEGIGAARRWLEAQFAACVPASGGRLEVAQQRAEMPCGRPGLPKTLPIVNVLATLRGTSDPDRVYVIGGHYDSRNDRAADGAGPAPGANDDASGTAVALEACRALCRQQFPATLVFAAFDAEEHGLLGSQAHAQALRAAGARVDGMIACDMVGNALGMDGGRYDGQVRCFSYAGSGNDGPGRSLARALTFAAGRHVPAFGVKLVFRGDRFGRGGDHRPFSDAGWPAVRCTELREDFSRQHQGELVRDGRPYGDVPDYVDFAYAANVTRVAVATLAELASAPPPPLVVSAQLRRDRYDTEIVFELPDAGAGCEFVWRETTAPDWTAVVAATTARVEELRPGRRKAILANVCLDDVVVGVRAVGADGSRSRVATPPEPGSEPARAADAPREGR